MALKGSVRIGATGATQAVWVAPRRRGRGLTEEGRVAARADELSCLPEQGSGPTDRRAPIHSIGFGCGHLSLWPPYAFALLASRERGRLKLNHWPLIDQEGDERVKQKHQIDQLQSGVVRDKIFGGAVTSSN